MADSYFVYVIAAMSITFGFIALLRQRTYIIQDPENPEDSKTEIEVPFLNKLVRLKTNYPSLVFVLVGFILTWMAASRATESSPCRPAPKKTWQISGTLKQSGDDSIRWQQGTLAIHPVDVELSVNESGRFEIRAWIEEGKTFEEVVELIDYTNGNFSKTIIPGEEMDKFESGDPDSLVQSATDTTRTYKPILIDSWPDEARLQ